MTNTEKKIFNLKGLVGDLKQQKKVPIVFSTDDNYAPFCGVAVYSLLKNSNHNTFYDIYIIDGGISKINKTRFNELHESFDNHEIYFLTPDVDFKHLQQKSKAQSQNYFYRFLIPDLLTQYKKIIYLDCDILILSDLQELFEIELKENVVGVVHDNLVYERYLREKQNNQFYHYIGMSKKNMQRYFNSGVILMDLEKFRDLEIFKKLMLFYETYKNRFFKDQNAMNWALKGKTLLLDNDWNLIQSNTKAIVDISLNKSKPNIIHFTPVRPWEFHSNKFNERKKILKSYLPEFDKDLPVYYDTLMQFKSLWKEISKESPWSEAYESYKKKYDKNRGYLMNQPKGGKNNRITDLINLFLEIIPVPFIREFLLRFLIYINKTFFIFNSQAGFFTIQSNQRMPFKILFNACLFLIPSITLRENAKKSIVFILVTILGWIIRLNLKIQLAFKPLKFNCSIENNKLIVSLTTIPERLGSVYWALLTLLNQSLKPERVILWIEKSTINDIPKRIRSLINLGVEIKFTTDLGPHTKLIPALKKNPDHIIVTADDDILYPEYWLEDLYNSYKTFPEYIHAHRVKKITFSGPFIDPYEFWEVDISSKDASYLNFLTGVGGVLYPPGTLHEEVFNYKNFKNLCPKADDIWFYAMAIKKGTKIKRVESGWTNLVWVNTFEEYYSKDATLAGYNVILGGNDTQLKNMIEYYGLKDIIMKDL